MIFGWLEVAARFDLDVDWRAPLASLPGLADHPHVRPGWSGRNDLYVAAERLSLRPDLPGGGVLARAAPLTEPGARLTTRWALPPFFRQTGLTYHPAPAWRPDHLRAAAQGQEFVATIGDRADARDWLRALFAGYA